MERYVGIPWGPTFEGGKCVSPAHVLRIPTGDKRPKGIEGELYANETSEMLEVKIGDEWVIIGKIKDYCS